MLESAKVSASPADSQRSSLPLRELMMHSRLMTMLAPDGAILASVLAKIPNLMALYVFGSQVLGSPRPESDLDLLDLRAASTVMQYQVLSTGKTVRDIGLQARLFEVSVFSEKLALDESREPLLKTITREGHVYAR